mmetsp:Transcript_11664/g.41659  ORF Transcript_11664/g.41659 Transcript_11664/m.41659 type:complete len:344 (+) Transcript_11664:281-1312(+)
MSERLRLFDLHQPIAIFVLDRADVLLAIGVVPDGGGRPDHSPILRLLDVLVALHVLGRPGEEHGGEQDASEAALGDSVGHDEVEVPRRHVRRRRVKDLQHHRDGEKEPGEQDEPLQSLVEQDLVFGLLPLQHLDEASHLLVHRHQHDGAHHEDRQGAEQHRCQRERESVHVALDVELVVLQPWAALPQSGACILGSLRWVGHDRIEAGNRLPDRRQSREQENKWRKVTGAVPHLEEAPPRSRLRDAKRKRQQDALLDVQQGLPPAQAEQRPNDSHGQIEGNNKSVKRLLATVDRWQEAPCILDFDAPQNGDAVHVPAIGENQNVQARLAQELLRASAVARNDA